MSGPIDRNLKAQLEVSRQMQGPVQQLFEIAEDELHQLGAPAGARYALQLPLWLCEADESVVRQFARDWYQQRAAASVTIEDEPSQAEAQVAADLIREHDTRAMARAMREAFERPFPADP